ncbi:MAG TPA: lipocalin family protein [Spirochaetia bacterium]|nr:lipocalin family protein [Spirochaetia bacterium]
MKTHTAFARSPSSLFALFGAASKSLRPLQLVENLDTKRYLGRWYEIGRFQHRFEKSLVGVTADYSPRADGRVQVINSGFMNDLNGPYREARGIAWVPDPRRPGALKVRFFWPFAGNYLVFGLDQTDYSWALVGDNSRRYLWFLARTPQISAGLFEKMKQIALDQDYNLAELYAVPQKPR